ncbi:MAG: hypothetical protein JW730_18300 [Anaerolineales bacterium]|nr:hypothetical protein [Anaerolineales bacterium]
MIPAFAVMVGGYIWTRMLALVLKKDEHIAVRVFAGIGLVAVPIICLDIFFTGQGVPAIP